MLINESQPVIRTLVAVPIRGAPGSEGRRQEDWHMGKSQHPERLVTRNAGSVFVYSRQSASEHHVYINPSEVDHKPMRRRTMYSPSKPRE